MSKRYSIDIGAFRAGCAGCQPIGPMPPNESPFTDMQNAEPMGVHLNASFWNAAPKFLMCQRFHVACPLYACTLSTNRYYTYRYAQETYEIKQRQREADDKATALANAEFANDRELNGYVAKIIEDE